MWLLESKHDKRERISYNFVNKIQAEEYLERLGPVIANHYRVVHESGDTITDRFLTEGLVKDDLQNILLPRVSIDEYVPSDPETDNVVIAFFIKGEPKATLPLKNFAEHSRGVLNTDYGDSETVVNTQIVYVEFDRENLEIQDICDLIIQVSMLASLNVEDFTMTFPHTNKKFPYDIDIMERYFTSRNQRKNKQAQQRAEKERQKQIHDELRALHKQDQKAQKEEEPQGEPEEQKTAQGEPQTPEEAMGDMPVKESLVERLSRVSFL